VRSLSTSVLFRRWRTWLLIAPLFSLAALSGPLAVAVCAGALGVQAATEYGSLARLASADRRLLMLAAMSVPLAAVVLTPERLVLLLAVLPLLATAPTLVQQDVERGRERVAALAFGLYYLALPLALMVKLASTPGLLLALALGVALSDVGAFTAGRLFGRRPLAPRLSPAKTWAGVAGNVLGASLGLALSIPLAPGAPLLALVPIVAIGAVWGDLLESLLKRSAGAKDTGAWLPGFGGLLDRIDSMLVVLPLAFVAVQVLA
jgi:phosphatidate cytidylyltransferase